MTDAPLEPAGGARWQTAVVAEIRVQTPRIKSFLFEPAARFDFVAGQHADVRLSAEDGYAAVRSYSIASAPADAGRIELAIERLDDGEVSPFFHDVVAHGDAIEFRAPLGGHFVWRPADGGPVLLIGAGSGVVPLLSMVRQRHAAQSDVPMALLLSSRTWDEVPFRDELLALHRARDGYSLTLALTREPGRDGGGASAHGFAPTALQDAPREYRRRIDDAMVAQVLDRLPAMPAHVYICGSNAFVNAAADGAIAARIAAAAIRTERYGT
jgi:glycine betaine catabolism B